MRKTSKDIGDSMSINSGVDNDLRKADINTKKRNSIKKKVQSLSHESDDAALVPLLQTYKDKTEIANTGAKFSFTKMKTDSITEEDHLINNDIDIERVALNKTITSTPNVSSFVVQEHGKFTLDSVITSSSNSTQNQIKNGFETPNNNVTFTSKCTHLVNICENQSNGLSSNPLIFTTAKIHANGKTKAMDPIQVTSVPIISTMVGNITKAQGSSTIKAENVPFHVESVKTSSDKVSICEIKDNTVNLKQSMKDVTVTSSGTIKKIPDLSTVNKVDNKVSERKLQDKDPISSNILSKNLTSQMITSDKNKDHKIGSQEQEKKEPCIELKTTNKTDIDTSKKAASEVRLDSTSSLKKLQRQKNASIEESKNSTLQQAENKKILNLTNNSDIKEKNTQDVFQNVHLKTNSIMQVDTVKKNTLSTVQTKTITTSPMPCKSGIEKVTNVSTVSPISKTVTTVKSITTGTMNSSKDSVLKQSSVATSIKPTRNNSKESVSSKQLPSTSTTKLINNNKDVSKDLVAKPQVPNSTSTGKSTVNLDPAKSSQIKSITSSETVPRGLPTDAPTSVHTPSSKTTQLPHMEDGKPTISSKQASSSTDNNASVSTPPYIVATSRTKIGGTSTTNTTGASNKSQIAKPLTEVVSTVKTTSMSISKPAVKSSLGTAKSIDTKTKNN